MARRLIAVPGALARRLHYLKRDPKERVTRGTRGRGRRGVLIGFGTRIASAVGLLAVIGIGAWFVFTK